MQLRRMIYPNIISIMFGLVMAMLISMHGSTHMGAWASPIPLATPAHALHPEGHAMYSPRAMIPYCVPIIEKLHYAQIHDIKVQMQLYQQASRRSR